MSRVLERRTFWLLALFAIAARLALIATTYGTNDAGFMAVSVDLVKRVGVARSYAHTAMMNHPPLSFALMTLIDRLATAVGIAFVDVFRFFQVVADVVAAVALFHIGRHTSIEHGRALALFILLSPGAAFISAFHCNTDATMIALILAAAALVAGNRNGLGGGMLALAAGIKIPPFLLAPIFGISLRSRGRLRFLASFAIVAAAVYLPWIIIGGPVVARVVFGYRGGLPYEWGVTGVAFALSRNVASFRALGMEVMKFWQTYGSWFVYVAIAMVIIMVWRRRPETPAAMLHGVGIMLMTILALAPGFGVQYIGWLIAFLPFAFPWRGAVVMNAAISTFLFVTYTVWSGGWPWWFADITRAGPYRWVAAVAGYAMWLIVCAALAVSVRRFTRDSRSETAH